MRMFEEEGTLNSQSIRDLERQREKECEGLR